MVELLSAQTIDRLKEYAEPLVDTVDSVVNRLIDAYEKKSPTPIRRASSDIAINAASPPNLAFTTVHSAILNGVRLPPSACNWNGILIAAIQMAKQGRTLDELDRLIISNHLIGKKTDNGYKYLEDLGISLQGQDANYAWKTTYHILKHAKLSVVVEFSWQENPKAAAPGETGTLSVSWQ